MQPLPARSFAGAGSGLQHSRPHFGIRHELIAQSRPHIARSRGDPLVVSAAGDGSDKGKKYGENLDDRIASGEFDDSGSTKEKMTRPLRKMLAKDPLGPGEACCLATWEEIRVTPLPCLPHCLANPPIAPSEPTLIPHCPPAPLPPPLQAARLPT